MRSVGPMERDMFCIAPPYESLCLDAFRALPPETWSRELWFADGLIDAVVNQECLNTLEALGFPVGLVGCSAAEMADQAGIAPDCRYAFDWILEKLASVGLLERQTAGVIERLLSGPWSATALETAVQQVREELGSTFELIAAVSRAYPDFLRGTVEGSRILAAPAAFPRWESYFQNGNLSYAAVNLLGAYASDKSVVSPQLRILEIGGGLGSGAEALLLRLSDRVECYWFTELNPFFLAQGKRFLSERFSTVPFEFKRVNINRSLVEQGVSTSSFDLVYAVNTLHVAHDLVASLQALRDTLAPGGRLVLAEGIRPRPGLPVAIEFVFQLAREFRSFKPEADCRTTGGFLYFQDWKTALTRAGYSTVWFEPDLEKAIEACPAYSIAAILAEK
jgi:SAM-dependent methyltransferase